MEISEERLKEIFGDVKVQVGLRQQGHMDTVIKMIRNAASWEEIGKAIGWHGPTARDWYIAESAAQLLAYRESGALEALGEIIGLIDAGVLVRDTSKDTASNWAIKQLPLIGALQHVQEAIAKLEAIEK